MNKLPNVLFLTTDQQSSWTLGVYGGTLIDAPHTDRIGREGAIATAFFTVSAVCTPSRGCLLTGRYPHCHGAYRNPVPIHRDEITLAHVLARNGYETSFVGKWHLDGDGCPPDSWIPRERAMGFDDSRFMLNRGHYKSVTGEGARIRLSEDPNRGRYISDWLTDRSLDILSRSGPRPFFHVLSFTDPHQPYRVREPYASLYEPSRMPLPVTLRDRRHPSWVEAVPMGAEFMGDRPDAEELLRARKAAYSGMVKCLDDNVGRLLAALEARGVLDDTLIVFTTDHGDYMGEHGLCGKNMVYETAYRIPFLARWPKAIPPGTVVNRIVSVVDVQQTVLGLLGLEPCGREQGRDASPLFRDEPVPWTDEAFLHHSRFGYAGLFTPDYELGLARCGEHALFDRRRDPEQTDNLIASPAHRAVRNALAERVVRHNRDLDSPAMEWLSDWTRADREQPRDADPSLVAMDWWRKRRRSDVTVSCGNGE